MTTRRFLPLYAAALLPVLAGSAMVARADQSYPAAGMTTAQVVKTFGEPKSKSAPVGLPPITHWVYDGFVVYFNRDKVIFHIKSAPGAAPAAATAAASPAADKKKAKTKDKHAKAAAVVAAPVAAEAAAAPAEAAPVAAAPVAVEPTPAPVAVTPPPTPAAAPAPLTTEAPHPVQHHTVTSSVTRTDTSDGSNAPTVRAVPTLQVVRAGLMRVLREDDVWYAGAAIGTGNYGKQAQAECDGALVHAGFSGSDCGSLKGGSVFKLYGGYNFGPMVSLELGVTELGSASYSTEVSQTVNFAFNKQVTIAGKVSARAINLDTSINLHPSDNGTLSLKLGAYTATNEITSTASGAAADSRDDINHSFVNSNTFVGLAGSYKLVGGLAAQLEWNRFRGLGLANQTSSRDVDLFLLGLKFTF